VNFEEYDLSARPLGSAGGPTVFARSRRPVTDGELGRYAPPGSGSYEIILTARDKAGNARGTCQHE
jgi:hypothetical protein